MKTIKTMKYLTLFSMLAVSHLSWADNAFTPAQEARIKAIVRETMVSDPSILEQAIVSLQNYQENKQTEQVQSFIQAHQKELYQQPASPRMGAKNPLVTLVVFTDYNCPYCKQFDPILEKVIQDNPEAALIIKYLPYKGETSVIAAAKATAVWQQQPDKFWALNDLLFKKTGMHTAETINQAMAKVGVDKINSGDAQIKVVKEDYNLATGLNVQGTPFTLVGNQPISGAIPYEQLNEIVKQQIALAKQKK
ncbi:DsbA family protein [Utexia brackfieldae]|uniref:DsbA family protein n=1 Tax=Utexia brackfieldae TaxID=3074108 RepID=UPI00370D4AEB